MLSKGMLWVDDTTGRPLDLKVERAASYYQQKYGAEPDVCYVHPSALSEGAPSFLSIKIVGARHVLPHHLWLGVSASAPHDDPAPA